MVSINLSEVDNKEQIAKVIRIRMENIGIKKSEICSGTNLSLTTINNVLNMEENEKDYMFGSLLKILKFLKIQLYIGQNEQVKDKVLSLF